MTPPATASPTNPRTVGVIGVGATGARTARQLVGCEEVSSVLLHGTGERPHILQRSLGDASSVRDPFAADDLAALVIASPAGTHGALASRAVERGVHVISVSDAIADVEALLALGPAAERAGVSVIAGAGFSPGMSCVLTAHVATWVDEVEEIHLARFGTGGPACARQHHVALSSRSFDWRDGEWLRRAGGSGRELAAFPEPIGSVDCYRAELPDALLLHSAFPAADRIAARQAANRRQRLTAWLPMLRRPHPEGRIGAIRVEVRGRRGGASVTEVVGAIDRPAVAAGAVAGLAARWAVGGRLRPGASGLAGQVEPTRFLRDLAEVGVRAAVFVGTS